MFSLTHTDTYLGVKSTVYVVSQCDVVVVILSRVNKCFTRPHPLDQSTLFGLKHCVITFFLRQMLSTYSMMYIFSPVRWLTKTLYASAAALAPRTLCDPLFRNFSHSYPRLTAVMEGFLPSPAGGCVTSAPRKITGC